MNEYTQQHILTIPIHLFHCLHSSLQLYQSPYGPLSLFYYLSLWPLSLSLSLWPLILIMDSWPLFPQNLAKQQFILINNNNNRSSYFPKKTIKLVFPWSHQRFPFLFFFEVHLDLFPIQPTPHQREGKLLFPGQPTQYPRERRLVAAILTVDKSVNHATDDIYLKILFNNNDSDNDTEDRKMRIRYKSMTSDLI